MADYKRKTVVCIEDQPEMIDLIRLILKQRGIHVIGAVGGQEGLDVVRRERPDLILLDLMMPVVDGWDVFRQVKADASLMGIPVVVVTAKVAQIDRVLAEAIAGVDAYITKPFAPSTLWSTVERLMGQVEQAPVSLQEMLRRLADDRQDPPLLEAQAIRLLAQRFGLTLREVEQAAIEARVLPRRYERSLGTVGWEGQARLLAATVAIIGAGGLGGWVIEGLARMGVGHLVVVDGDTFEESNLNRQALCSEAWLGRPKTEAARARVAEVNAAVEVTEHPVCADEDNLPDLLRGADVVVDALDRLPLRLTLQRVAQRLGIPMVHGAIGGYVGQVMTILPEDAGLRALYPGDQVPEQGLEVELGNPAATPMMAAAWQVQEVIKLLIGKGELLRHRLLLMDAEQGDITIFRFD
jgi:molybdopterin/thiamine biosynthesis adenylyltransferase/DNA-binding response OmpR family regulator